MLGDIIAAVHVYPCVVQRLNFRSSLSIDISELNLSVYRAFLKINGQNHLEPIQTVDETFYKTRNKIEIFVQKSNVFPFSIQFLPFFYTLDLQKHVSVCHHIIM